MRKRKNILLLVSDEHNATMAGFRNHPQVKTPHLDRLARQGTVFTQACCNTPICGPSRLSMMTGRHLHELRVWCNNVPWDGEAQSWAERLGETGYRTSSIGKMDVSGPHSTLGFQEFDELIPRPAMNPWPLALPRIYDCPEHSFDGFEGWATAGTVREENLLAAGRNPEELQTDWGPDEYLSGYYDHDRIVTDRVRTFLQKAKSDDRPWVLHVGLLLPHWPFVCPRRYMNLYDPDAINLPLDCRIPNEALHPALRAYQRSQNDYRAIRDEAHLRSIVASYYGMITCMDDLVGEILAELDAQNQAEDTVVLYTSDHGEACGEHGLFTKLTPYENSVAVPLILRDPGQASGTSCTAPVSLIDLFPTLCDYAGAPVPENLPGISLRSFAQTPDSSFDRSLLSQYHGIFPINNWFMLRRGEYKYIWYFGERPSLFNLKEDPGEMRDLYADPACAAIREELDRELRTLIDPESVAATARREFALPA